MSAYCGECGYYLSPKDIFCGNCGNKSEQNTYQNQTNQNYSNEDLEFETNYQKVLYSYHGLSIALLSKLAKVDGRVCENEAITEAKSEDKVLLDGLQQSINYAQKTSKGIINVRNF